MKKVTVLFISALFLAAGCGFANTARAQEVTWELMNPTGGLEITNTARTQDVVWELLNPMGGFEVTQVHAPRLDDLAGKTICELHADKWQSGRILPAIREELQAKYPTATLVPFTDLPQGEAVIDNDATAQAVKDRGCDAVIIASAG